jgi:uncharacterized protein YbjT (DUF2867 family)
MSRLAHGASRRREHWIIACFAAVALLLAAAGALAANDQPVVLVVGGSGDTGIEVMRAAVANNLHPRGMTRNRKRALEAHPRFDWIEADAREVAALANAMRGVRYVVCAIGAPAFEGPDSPQFIDYLGVVNVVDAAVVADVRHVVLISSASAGPHREPRKTPRLNYVLLWKTLAENHLKASGLPYTIIGPAGLIDGAPGRAGLAAIPRLEYQSTNVARSDVARVALESLTAAAARNKSFALVNTTDATPETWRSQIARLPLDASDLTSIESLAWLAGHWTRAEGGSTSEELWMPADAGLMLGLSRNISKDGAKQFEYMRIVERPDGVFFIASPGGGGATEFKLVALGERTATFVNAAHDFPNKIIYRRDENTLSATIHGVTDKGPQESSWRWTLQQPLRVPHLPPAAR